jgi:hypothetical protein
MNNHIETYVPTNWNPGTLHPLKCLFLARVYQKLVREYFEQDFINDDVMRRAMEHLKEDTGLTHEEATHAISIGMYIHDFIILENMSKEALEQYDTALTDEAFLMSISINDTSKDV